jgi:hypothetical protein
MDSHGGIQATKDLIRQHYTPVLRVLYSSGMARNKPYVAGYPEQQPPGPRAFHGTKPATSFGCGRAQLGHNASPHDIPFSCELPFSYFIYLRKRSVLLRKWLLIKLMITGRP